jgi:hypothetical protein
MNAHPMRTPARCLALLLGLAAIHWSAVTACAEDALATVADEQYRGLPVGAIVASGNDRTREEIVLQELLMQPGDPYEPQLARESERNLRALPFLGSARVIPRPDDSGGVRLEVTVTERFPWIGGALPSFGGGKFELDLAVGTGNFLGRGQLLGFRTFQSTEVEPSYYLAFAEPRVAGSRWGAGVFLGTQGEVGPRNRLELRRPLYSLSAEWGFDARLYDEAEERLLYDAGETVSDYYRRSRGGRFGAVRSFRRDDRRLELGLAYELRDETHEQAPDWDGALPLDKRRGLLRAHFTAERFRYVKDTYLSRMGPVEDLRLGLWGTVRAGASLRPLGSDRSYPTLGFALGWFEGSPGRGYVRVDVSADGRIEDGAISDAFAGATARLYVRTGTRGLIATRAQLHWLRDPEDPTQLLLGSPQGLRGYASHSSDGTRRLLFNVEWRQPLLRLGPIAVGTAAFLDGGAIWSATRRLGETPFLVGLGAGLRLGLAQVIGAPVLRLDVGYGTRAGSWEVSGGVGQRF